MVLPERLPNLLFKIVILSASLYHIKALAYLNLALSLLILMDTHVSLENTVAAETAQVALFLLDVGSLLVALALLTKCVVH